MLFCQWLVEQIDVKSIKIEKTEQCYQPAWATNIYKTLYPTIADYALFSIVHRTFNRIVRILGHKTNLDNLERMKIAQNLFSEHNRIKLEINDRKIWKIPVIWKLNSILLNHLLFKEEIQRETGKCFKLKMKTHQNLPRKQHLRGGICSPKSLCVRKEEKSQVNDFRFHPKNPEKE